jgi:uncharacterized membrane protein YphA (DoxX/SURF4 family)
VVAALISPPAALRSLAVVVVLLVVAVVLAGLLGPLGFVGLVTWSLLIGGLVAGGFLIARAGRPLAGAGAIVMPLSTWLAFFVQPPAFVWTGLFFIGAALIALGTRADTPLTTSWPVLMLRTVVGWAWVDNAQDHFINNWVPGGGAFLQQATASAGRPPANFLDAAYQGFLRSVIVPGGEQWASLTLCGELSFGLLLAMGFLTPIATLGLLWHSLNYMLMRGFATHGPYTDKTFFTADLFLLIVLAGLSYGLDAALRRHVPSAVARWLMGASSEETMAAPHPSRQPQPA